MHDQLAAIWMMPSFRIKKKSSGRTWSFFQLHSELYINTWSMLPDWLIDGSSWVFVAFLKILKKHDRITGIHIRQKFCMQTLNHMDFVLYASVVNEDAEYCLSLLKRIPNPHMRSSTRGCSLPRSKTTHVQSDCESSSGPSSSAAAHPSPLISTRGRELSLHLWQQRLQLLNSSDGSFNYITAAKAAKAANHMVCKTVSSIFNSESVVVLYRTPPQPLPFKTTISSWRCRFHALELVH
jgi:hypothetical protein